MLSPSALLFSPGRYVLRVVNKDMTYATQLKDYEDAVISKRFEELRALAMNVKARRAAA